MRFGARSVLVVVLAVRGRLLLGDPAFLGDLRDTVRDVADDVETRDALLLEEIGGVRVRLAENGDQDVAAEDLVLSRRLHVRGGALNHPLKADGLLRRGVVALRQPLQLLVEELLQRALQLGDVTAAVTHDLGDVAVMQERVQHVLDAQELVAATTRLADGEGETDLELAADAHQASSMLQRSGYSCVRANASTWPIRVSATSRV